MTISTHSVTLKKGWLIAAAILSLVLFWTVQRATAATVQSSDQRMVTVYDRGSERTIITRATTVKAALDQAEITVEPADVVEPKLSQELVAKNYHVNVYRARPVLIVDGVSQYHVITAQQSPRQIAKAADLTLYDEDIAQIDRVDNDDVLSDGGAGLKLNITRATPFTFVQYGKQFIARTQAKTVGEMLTEKGIKLAAVDGTSLPLATPITANMTVSVWRNGVQTITQEEAISMPVEKVQDQDQPVGYHAVKTPGTDGKKQVTYQINMQNGTEVSRTVIQEVQTLAPVKQVEVVGAKPVFTGDFAAALLKLRTCEAGGDYANKHNPKYRGAYQYDFSTWANYQGYYDPADAPPAVQDQKAWETYQRRGWQPWPSCGASLPDIYR